MIKKTNIKEAMDSLKLYRTRAQSLSEKQLELLTKMINQVREYGDIPLADRSPQQQAVLDFFYFLSDEITAALEAADEYNKSINDYVNGLNILTNIASLKDESN